MLVVVSPLVDVRTAGVVGGAAATESEISSVSDHSDVAVVHDWLEIVRKLGGFLEGVRTAYEDYDRGGFIFNLLFLD